MVHEGDRALLMPWRRSTAPERASSGVAFTPDGPAWFWSARHGATTTTVYLPRLGPLAGLERIGIHAVGSLLASTLVAALGLLLMLGDDSVRRRLSVALRSYSRRLILILTVLIVAPLLLLDAVLVRALDQRLESEHRAAAEVALEVAQRVLSDYVLALDPGFGIGAALDRRCSTGWRRRWTRGQPLLGVQSSFEPSRAVRRGPALTRCPGRSGSSRCGGTGSRRAPHRRGPHLPRALRAARGGGSRRAARCRFSCRRRCSRRRRRWARTRRLRRRVVVATLALFAAARRGRPAGRRVHPAGEEIVRAPIGSRRRHLARNPPEEAELGRWWRRSTGWRGGWPRAAQTCWREAGGGADDRVDDRGGGVAGPGPPGDDAQSRRREFARRGGGRRFAPVAAMAPTRLAQFLAARIARPAGSPAPPAAIGRGRGAGMEGGVGPAGRRRRARGAGRGRGRDRGPARAAARGLGGDGAHHRARDQEPADADPALDRAPARGLGRRPRALRGSVRALHDEHPVQVEELRAIASEFSPYSRVPHIDLRQGDVVALARSVEATAGAAAGRRIVRDRRPGGAGSLRPTAPGAGAAQPDRELGARRPRRGGVRSGSTANGAIAIGLRTAGPASRRDMRRILEPYFSTHAAGKGLGLPIARRIVEVHGGSIIAANRAGGGLSVRITLPLHDGVVRGGFRPRDATPAAAFQRRPEWARALPRPGSARTGRHLRRADRHLVDYVPLHGLLHAFGCELGGGRVWRLKIDPLYGGALLARWLPFVEAGGEYAGRLAGFDTAGSVAVHLFTTGLPFLLTPVPRCLALAVGSATCPGSRLRRWTGSRHRALPVIDRRRLRDRVVAHHADLAVVERAGAHHADRRRHHRRGVRSRRRRLRCSGVG